MRDKYDEAIERLTKHPEDIVSAWYSGNVLHPTGCLFAFATPDGNANYGNMWCGCLTSIRSKPKEYPAFTPELTEAISGDERIPKDSADITLEHLPVFAEWQRRLDKEIRQPAEDSP